MERDYTFIVCVNDKPVKIFNHWFCQNEQEMKMQASSICSGAKVFKKTASVVVNQFIDGKYEFVHSCH